MLYHFSTPPEHLSGSGIWFIFFVEPHHIRLWKVLCSCRRPLYLLSSAPLVKCYSSHSILCFCQKSIVWPIIIELVHIFGRVVVSKHIPPVYSQFYRTRFPMHWTIKIEKLSNTRKVNSKLWQREIWGSACHVRVAYHFLWDRYKEAMLLASYSWLSHH